VSVAGTATETQTQELRITFQPDWDPDTAAAGRRGLFALDPRVRTLLRVLLSYPEVRYIVPDRISLDGSASPALLETIARFLDRQTWLVRRAHIG
jgi:hypothetical protein